jgi:serine/threonine-protein kinase
MVQPRTDAQGAIQFQYLAEIAVGTTARVDLCRATSPPHLAGRLLAVKRLHQHIAEDPSFANQFLDEVWMTASLKHPNVVEVAGWGNDDQGMYLAVELVQGVSLARLMKTIFDTGEAFTERMVVYIASRLCRGLAAAHSLRAQNGELLHLVHRDLTPGNVLVGFNGDLKITDFGLAKAKQRLTKTLTGLLKGQPAYMAPEQARGDQIDLRTDLFALGVLMFELFAGRKPWNVTSDFDAVQAILTRPPDDLRELRPKIDKELAAVVQRCLEKEPAARFQSANEIQARLDEWLLVHGYQEGNEEALARFVRRNAMRQMRWFERAVAGELTEGRPEPPRAAAFTGQNPPVSLGGAAEDSEATDVTDVEGMGRGTVRMDDDEGDNGESEEVPTIVQKAGALPLPLPLKQRAGPPGAPAARPAPAARAPIKPPAPAPRAPQRSAPTVPQPAASGIRPQSAPPPAASGVRPPAAPAARLQRPTTPMAGAAALPLALPDARAMHDSISDEDSDARTTNVKARSSRPGPGRAPIIITPQRGPAPSISDSESEEVPTLPLQGLPPIVRPQGAPAAPSSPLPGQMARPDPRMQQGAASLQAAEEDWQQRGPMSEDRLFAEADRLALEAVRFSDEAKLAAARAERQAVVSKIAGDAAAIAVEAVRLASTAGIAEAARRLEDAYALEATIRRLAAAPLDVPAQVPASAARSTARLPPSGMPSSPALSSPLSGSRDRPSFAPPPPGSVAPGPLSPATAPLPPQGARPDMGAMQPLPQPQSAQGTGAFEAFEARLRPTIFGLPGLHVAALAIGTFVLVLVLMWLLMG